MLPSSTKSSDNGTMKVILNIHFPVLNLEISFLVLIS